MNDNSKEDEVAQRIIDVIREKNPSTVRELVDHVRQNVPIAERKVVEHIQKLQREGRITLREPYKPLSPGLASYLRSASAQWFWGIMVLAASTVFVVFAVPEDMFPLAYIRYVLGTVFTVWLPGYSLVKALFPRKIGNDESEEDLDSAERVGLSVGLSLALVPLIVLLLNYTPWGVRLIPIVLSLFGFTALAASAAVVREHRTRFRESL